MRDALFSTDSQEQWDGFLWVWPTRGRSEINIVLGRDLLEAMKLHHQWNTGMSEYLGFFIVLTESTPNAAYFEVVDYRAYKCELIT